MPTATSAINLLEDGKYFSSQGEVKQGSTHPADKYTTWPVVLQAVVRGTESGASSLCMSAIGGVVWQLRRAQIDFEVLSMGQVYGYVPPDDTNNTVSALVDEGDSAVAPKLAETAATGKEGSISCGNHTGPVSEDKVMAGGGGLLVGGGGGRRHEAMTLDAVSLANLEILFNNFDRTEKGSLWAFVDRTRTAFGRRLLKEWVCNPLYRAQDIAKRAAAVEELLSNCAEEAVRARMILKGVPDLERLLTRVHSNGLKKKGADHPDSRAIL
jgi:DNA mismatch repair protein MSH6